MKKITNVVLKIVLALMMIMPILGTLGIFPAPTRDLYNTDLAFNFIEMLMNVGYINWMMGVVFFISLILIIKNKMALVALLLLPITLNIVGFHAFIDGGLFTSGAIMGNVLFLINIYFLCQNKKVYKSLY
jgi:hypothetical protein